MEERAAQPAWLGQVLEQLQRGSALTTESCAHFPGPADMRRWIARVVASASVYPPGEQTRMRERATQYVHSRMLQWAGTGDVLTKRWRLEPLPSEEQLISSPELAPCAICYEVLSSPMRLACGHTFCAGCVTKLVISCYQSGRAPACPYRCEPVWLEPSEIPEADFGEEDDIYNTELNMCRV